MERRRKLWMLPWPRLFASLKYRTLDLYACPFLSLIYPSPCTTRCVRRISRGSNAWPSWSTFLKPKTESDARHQASHGTLSQARLLCFPSHWLILPVRWRVTGFCRTSRSPRCGINYRTWYSMGFYYIFILCYNFILGISCYLAFNEIWFFDIYF